jgi:hypothetical protein
MTIRFDCRLATGGNYEACQFTLEVPDDQAGTTVKCPKCGAAVQVPIPAGPPTARRYDHDRPPAPMTEADWLACTDPRLMQEFLHGKVSDRKLRLFAVACCRRFWTKLTDPRSRQSVEAAEMYADGLISYIALEEAASAADDYFGSTCIYGTSTGDQLARAAEFAAVPLKISSGSRMTTLAWFSECAVWGMLNASEEGEAAYQSGLANQVPVLREVVGNPFRPVVVQPGWLTTNVTALAQAIYEQKAFDRLPILADALEDAGCTNAEVLNHCRQPGIHVRGCWALDLLLGKK